MISALRVLASLLPTVHGLSWSSPDTPVAAVQPTSHSLCGGASAGYHSRVHLRLTSLAPAETREAASSGEAVMEPTQELHLTSKAPIF